jgi:5-oxoprolinase (ATP-hydrolysing) subunit A
MGESLDFLDSGHDASLMPFITSVNIACGAHAGNKHIMAKTIENAIANDLKIGAHPGFYDLKNFGRKEIELSVVEIKYLIKKQLDLISKLTGQFGVSLNHVKPHGALYNMSAVRQDYARAIAEAVYEFDNSLILYGLSGSLSITEGAVFGLTTAEECFADRTYLSNATLAPRTLPNAVKVDLEEVKKQAHSLANELEIISFEGKAIRLNCDSICIHSDTPQALEFAKAIAAIIL